MPATEVAIAAQRHRGESRHLSQEALLWRQTVVQLLPWSQVRCTSATDPVPVGTRDWLEMRNPVPPWVNTRPPSSGPGPQLGACGGDGSQLVAWDVISSVGGGGGLAPTVAAMGTRKVIAATTGASLEIGRA